MTRIDIITAEEAARIQPDYTLPNLEVEFINRSIAEARSRGMSAGHFEQRAFNSDVRIVMMALKQAGYASETANRFDKVPIITWALPDPQR